VSINIFPNALENINKSSTILGKILMLVVPITSFHCKLPQSCATSTKIYCTRKLHLWHLNDPVGLVMDIVCFVLDITKNNFFILQYVPWTTHRTWLNYATMKNFLACNDKHRSRILCSCIGSRWGLQSQFRWKCSIRRWILVHRRSLCCRGRWSRRLWGCLIGTLGHLYICLF